MKLNIYKSKEFSISDGKNNYKFDRTNKLATNVENKFIHDTYLQKLISDSETISLNVTDVKSNTLAIASIVNVFVDFVDIYGLKEAIDKFEKYTSRSSVYKNFVDVMYYIPTYTSKKIKAKNKFAFYFHNKENDYVDIEEIYPHNNLHTYFTVSYFLNSLNDKELFFLKNKVSDRDLLSITTYILFSYIDKHARDNYDIDDFIFEINQRLNISSSMAYRSIRNLVIDSTRYEYKMSKDKHIVLLSSKYGQFNTASFIGFLHAPFVILKQTQDIDSKEKTKYLITMLNRISLNLKALAEDLNNQLPGGNWFTSGSYVKNNKPIYIDNDKIMGIVGKHINPQHTPKILER